MSASPPSPFGDEPQAFCVHCGCDLARRWPAKFCPACGKPVRAKVNWGSIVGRGLLHLITLGRFWRRRPLCPEACSPASPILLGYGNAMFKLGGRYERGNGTFRNLPEAMRCYDKSARLGNADAKLRLMHLNPQRSSAPRSRRIL